MNPETPASFIPQIGGMVFIFAALVMHWFPPRTMNHFYGYRSRKSKKHQGNWDLAQKLMRTRFLFLGGIFFAIGAVSKKLELSETLGAIYGVTVLAVGLGYVIWSIEKELE